MLQTLVIPLAVLFETCFAKLNFVTIYANHDSSGDYHSLLDVALSDLQQKYPEAMANYTWTAFINASPTVHICLPDDYFGTYSAISSYYGSGVFETNKALTVIFCPSKCTEYRSTNLTFNFLDRQNKLCRAENYISSSCCMKNRWSEHPVLISVILNQQPDQY